MPVETISAAVEGGVDAVHLRDHAASARDLYARGIELRRFDCWLIVNDRIDVALALGADGVQLGGRSLHLEDARRAAGGLALGVSIHGVEEGEAVARAGGADWVVLGPVHPTASHPGAATLGTDPIGRTPGTVIAIGGISAENVSAVLAAGAHGVAVISSILNARSPRAAARQIRELMG